jgi:hypothetical protein
MVAKKSGKSNVHKPKAKKLSAKKNRQLDKALNKWENAQSRNNESLDI